MLELLLDHGADINRRDSMYGESALHWAVRKADITVMAFLLDHGADPTLPSCPNGDTPLHVLYSCDMDDSCMEIAQLLVDRGADVNAMPSGHHSRETVLHIAARRQLVNMTRLLLNVSHIDADVQDGNNNTPLRIVIKNGFEPIQKLLIEKGCSISEVINNRSDVAYAISHGAYEAAATLISHGAPVKNIDSDHPLHVLFSVESAVNIAKSTKLTSLVRTLLEAGDSTGKRSDTNSPLSKAVMAGESGLVELLMAYSDEKPWSLFGVCRHAVKSQLRCVSHGGSIRAKLSHLPLPLIIREQLLLQTPALKSAKG